MLSDFERKLSQIIRNDITITGHEPSIDAPEQRTGHDADEIRRTIDKLKKIPLRYGGIGQ